MKVVAYKSPYTGELFEECDKKEYTLHLRRERNARKKLKAQNSLRDGFANWLAEEKQHITHIDMVAPWVLKNQRIIMDALNAGCRPKKSMSFTPNAKTYETDVIADLSLKKYKFTYTLSNSHNCLEAGVTNWGGHNENAPLGYPGFGGQVEGSLIRSPKHASSYPMSGILNLLGIKTGSGGGGNESWSYGFSIFIADWPGLQVQVDNMEIDKIVGILKGR
jgi:hypothetical protein